MLNSYCSWPINFIAEYKSERYGWLFSQRSFNRNVPVRKYIFRISDIVNKMKSMNVALVPMYLTLNKHWRTEATIDHIHCGVRKRLAVFIYQYFLHNNISFINIPVNISSIDSNNWNSAYNIKSKLLRSIKFMREKN